MKNIFKGIKPFSVKYEPEILMVSGICGMLTSIVISVKATSKSKDDIEYYKIINNKNSLSKKETLKIVWKNYIPVLILPVISVPCIIASNRISSKRNTALMAAYTLAETSLQEYKEKTKEIVGEKKEREIHEAISSDKVNKKEFSSSVILTGNGESLFFEPISGRYFKSNWNKIVSEANRLNANAISGDDEITLTDWFSALGLEKTNISDAIGWSTSKNGRKGLIEISLDAVLTPNNEACGAIYYNNDPEAL